MNQPQTTHFSLRRKLAYTTFLCFIFLIMIEIVIRLFYQIGSIAAPRSMQYTDGPGWRTTPQVKSTRSFPGYGEIEYSTTRNGFRVFGDPRSDKQKIFVIGDSQTQSRKVSDGGTYFDFIGRQSDSEIFAYGGGGYGSLQEYMILDEFLDEILPDLIIWQYCDNDIHNNSFDLEVSSWKTNNRMTRPYLEDGGINYRFPHNSWIYRNVLRHSYLVQFFNLRLDLAMAENNEPISSELLTDSNPLFLRAVDTSKEIMKMVKKRAGSVPLVAFSACGGNHYKNVDMDNLFAEISSAAGIAYIGGVPGTIEAAKASGKKVDGEPHDRHWNALGNQIAGQHILSYLRVNDLIGM